MADQPYPLPAGPQDHEVVPRPFRPVATNILLVLNFVFFFLEIHAGGTDNSSILLNFGASFGPYLNRGDYWRLVMPIFLHGGWVHILGNNFALYILGPFMERVYGYGRYVTIYVASGMAGALLSMEVSKNVSVGASGAILGLAGAMLVAGYFHRDAIPPRWDRAFGMGVLPFIALTLALGLWVHRIDNWGHLGGLAAGALLAFVLPPPRHDSHYDGVAQSSSQAIIVLPLVVVILAISATAVHYRTLQTMNRLLAEGKKLESARQFDRAFRFYQQALALTPHEEEALEAMGSFYLKQRKFDPAIKDFMEAVRLSGEDDQPRIDLGLAYQMKGDPQKAQQLFEEVFGKTPQTSEGKELLASNQMILAGLYGEQKLYGDAIKTYQQVLRLEPGLAIAHNNLAWLYATCDDPKYRDPRSALDHAQLAVKLSPWKDPSFLDTLAEALFVNGGYQQAVQVEMQALALQPDNTELQKNLARYRQAAGK
jgi:rhomboid protease GluP